MIMNGKKRIRLSHTFVLYSTAINGNLVTKFLKIGQGRDVLGVQAKITNFDRLEWVLFAYITCIYFKIQGVYAKSTHFCNIDFSVFYE